MGYSKNLPPLSEVGNKNCISKTKEYKAWKDMLQRCTNPKCKRFKDYGARGISVSPSWHTYSNFIQDIGKAPSPKHSLDRIDNNKGYSKENCRWANQFEQNRNRRNNNFLTIDGSTKTLTEWCEIAKIGRTTASNRLRKGMSPKEAVFNEIDLRRSRRAA